MSNTVRMKVGPQLGEILLDIAQNNIEHGNIDKGINAYTDSLCGFTKEYVMMLLKNEAVLVTDDDGEGVSLSDDVNLIEENKHNIRDWNSFIAQKKQYIYDLIDSLLNYTKEFQKYYLGDITNYSIIEMMHRYFTDDELKSIGVHTIAARIIGSENGRIDNIQLGNPQRAWDRFENHCEDSDDAAKWELILYYTVKYNLTIRSLVKTFLEFDSTYFFLLENNMIERIPYAERFIGTMCAEYISEYCDTSKGYYHPLCDPGLYDLKEKFMTDLCHTKWGKEYCQNGIIQTNIMDGYDAGWLSPEGEFYGGNGDTSSLIHMNIAEDIFNGNNKYATEMSNDGVFKFSSNSPEEWLQKNGWIKIHHDEIYGSFIGSRDPNKRTKDFPYHYCPTAIQVQMICDYADKFYGGKFVTESRVIGLKDNPQTSTYKVRQMDEFKLHETFTF